MLPEFEYPRSNSHILLKAYVPPYTRLSELVCLYWYYIAYCQSSQHFSFLLFSRPFTNGFQVNFTSLNKLVFLYLSLRLFTDGVEEFIMLGIT